VFFVVVVVAFGAVGLLGALLELLASRAGVKGPGAREIDLAVLQGARA